MITPCIQVCTLIDGYCKGCGRSKEQIIKWRSYTDEERKEIMENLKCGESYE
jgi:hypothetical protein